MTYFSVLAYFVVLPMIGLALLNLWHTKQQRPISPAFGLLPPVYLLLALVFVAVTYTTPWDNYLVATSVWWYDPALVTGLVIGWVPIEEYSFFVLQTLMTGLWVLLCMRYVQPNAPFHPNRALRQAAVIFVGALWLCAAGVLLSGWDAGTYLGLEMIWALPPIALQLAVGADILWHHRRFVGFTVATATIYLCLVDAVGIGGGTWTINPQLTTGVMVGSLPLEEALFFLVTNILLVFGLTLGLSTRTKSRLPQAVQQALRIR